MRLVSRPPISLLFFLGFLAPAAGAPVPCDGGVCLVSDNAGTTLRIAPFATPRVIDDGFGFKQKVPGGLVELKAGGTNYGFSDWWWFSVAKPGQSSPEIPVAGEQHLLSDPQISLTQDNAIQTIRMTFTNDNVADISLTYSIVPGNSTGVFDLLSLAEMTNRSGGAATLRLYQYIDLDLSPGGVSDTAEFCGGLLSQTTASNNSCSVPPYVHVNFLGGGIGDVAREAIEPGAFGGRTVENGGRPTLLDRLNDGQASNFGGGPELIEGADIIVVRQFDGRLNTPNGTGMTVGTALVLANLIPEPSTFSLFCLAIVGMLTARRKPH